MMPVGLRVQFGFYETAGYGTFIYPVSPGRMDLEVCGMLLAPYSPTLSTAAAHAVTRYTGLGLCRRRHEASSMHHRDGHCCRGASSSCAVAMGCV